jgi:hypothetical protein
MPDSSQYNSRKDRFRQKYADYSEKDLLLELLYSIKNSNSIQERNRQNTSKLVWWLVALPIIFAGFFFFLTLIGLGSL